MKASAATMRARDELFMRGGQPVLPPGTPVEVRRRFDFSWARGFDVAEVVGSGYRVRRRSDGTVLPSEFVFDDVRPEQRRGGW